MRWEGRPEVGYTHCTALHCTVPGLRMRPTPLSRTSSNSSAPRASDAILSPLRSRLFDRSKNCNRPVNFCMNISMPKSDTLKHFDRCNRRNLPHFSPIKANDVSSNSALSWTFKAVKAGQPSAIHSNALAEKRFRARLRVCSWVIFTRNPERASAERRLVSKNRARTRARARERERERESRRERM